MIVVGTILLLSCPVCGAQHPHFEFSGDTDMATDGLTSAGDREGSRLALFHSSQVHGDRLDPAGDLRSARLARVVQHGPSAAGQDFQSFLKDYRPAELIFHCPWCDGESMTVSSETEPLGFEAAGGTIECIGNIELRKGPAAS